VGKQIVIRFGEVERTLWVHFLLIRARLSVRSIMGDVAKANELSQNRGLKKFTALPTIERISSAGILIF
jgi:hypothetical protein